MSRKVPGSIGIGFGTVRYDSPLTPAGVPPPSGTARVVRAVSDPRAVGESPFDDAVRLLCTALDTMDAPVIITDLEGRLRYANEAAGRVYGRPVQALIGESAALVGGVQLDEGMAAAIMTALASGQTWDGDFTLVSRDGTTLSVHAADSGLYDAAGRLVGVVSVMRDVTAQRRSIDRLSRETSSLRFLLDATTLLSSSLDFRECLQGLAALAVPVLGDLCLIDMVVEDGIVRMAAAHAQPSRAALVQELLERYPPDERGLHPAVATMKDGLSRLSPSMTPEFLRSTTRDARHLEIVTELGFTSFMCAPLRARGRTIGAVTFVSAGSGRRFDDGDLALAEDLASRAALVVDNARLFSERSVVARTLQAALLPPTLPEIPGMEVGARYRASGEANDVGGDFYDVYSVGRGTWVAGVGDVSGRGPSAAAVTGLVRHAIHASAQQRADPVAMLQTANALLLAGTDGPERFCSACCAVIRPGATARLTIASAGHPPALIRRSDGTVEEITAVGMLLGIAVDPAMTRSRDVLRPGDHLVLYTDGLLEARDGEERFFGDAALKPALAACTGLTADAIAGRLLAEVERFSGGEVTDDLALLVLGVPS
jgi:PAS domain S-box-containing protein